MDKIESILERINDDIELSAKGKVCCICELPKGIMLKAINKRGQDCYMCLDCLKMVSK